MSKEGTCQNCYSYGTIELHHIIKKSNTKFLRDCSLNFIYLCPNCHRGTFGVHGKNGSKLDKGLRLIYQNKIEILLNKEYFTREELKDIFKINEKALDSFCKLMRSEKGMFSREEVLREACGGEIIEEGDEEYEQSTVSI